MATANDKRTEVVRLISGEGFALDTVCGLAGHQLGVAREEKHTMTTIYHETSEQHGEMLSNKNGKGSKLIARTIMSKIKELYASFDEHYIPFNEMFDETMKLKSEKKNNVKACCKTFNMIEDDKGMTEKDESLKRRIIKGYRTQVTIIKAILAKIEKYFAEYLDIKKVVDELKALMDKLLHGAEMVSASIAN